MALNPRYLCPASCPLCVAVSVFLTLCESMITKVVYSLHDRDHHRGGEGREGAGLGLEEGAEYLRSVKNNSLGATRPAGQEHLAVGE